MARRGRKRQTEVESRYWQLLLSGVGTVMACEQVGINRKTGYRWRAENGGVPPARLADAVRSNRYLSILERQRIATLRARGAGIREIASRLDRSASTVSRELRRNARPHDRGGYDGDLAHARSRQAVQRSRPSRLRADADLRSLVQGRLELEWSPEQIAADLRLRFPEQREWHICHETIYQGLYRGGTGGLSCTLTKKLRTGRPLRKRRRRPDQHSSRFVTPGRLIHHRPAQAAARVRVCDWEGDLIVGRMSRSAIGTLVDRHSRYLRLIHLPNGHQAEQPLTAITAPLLSLPAQGRWTLTWDQGSEMACHEQIAQMFTQGVYFALPGSPWMRPTNEHTNGLLRQHFPKGTDLSIRSPQDLRLVEKRLNNRPRKVLGW